MKSPPELFLEGAARLGLSPSESQIAPFLIYLDELKRWNRRINLTSLTGNREIIEQHFLDSLMGCKGFEPHHPCRPYRGLRLLDIGAGAGFPGIPLKLLYPEIHLTLVESAHKKTAFLHHLCGIMKLEGVSILSERIESLQQRTEHRHSYDLVVARAFAKPSIAWAAARPFMAARGRILLYLTPSGAKQLKPMPGWKTESVEYRLPFSGAQRTLVILTQEGGSSSVDVPRGTVNGRLPRISFT